MILRGDVPRRFTPIGLMAAFVLLILAVPSWSAVSTPLDAQRAAAILFQSAFELATRAANADGKLLEKDANKDAADDEGKANDGKNNSTVPASPAKVKARSKVKESDLDIDVSAIEKEIESKFGPGSDFEKKMEAFAREIEAMFGSGSDFEKRMEAFGKDMEAKFGSGSDFEKRMEAFGKDVEARLGPGSDFEKKIEAFGKDMEAKFGPRSDFAEKIKNESRAGVDTKGQRKVLEKRSARMRSGTGDAKASAGAMNRRRERRIQELEAQIDRLVNEIKALKSDDTREKDENQ